LHDAAGGCIARARAAQLRAGDGGRTARPLLPLLRAEAGLSRWRRGIRAHRHRRIRELPEAREAARARPPGAPLTGMPTFEGKQVLVTGAAGFIGMHVAAALLDARAHVIGVDNLDPYYDVELKRARIAE